MPRAINVCKTLNPVQAFLVVQRGSDCPSTGDIQNQIVWGPGQPLDHGRELEGSPLQPKPFYDLAPKISRAYIITYSQV